MLVINVKRGASYELNSDFILSRDKIPWNNLIQLAIMLQTKSRLPLRSGCKDCSRDIVRLGIIGKFRILIVSSGYRISRGE